MTKIFRFIGMVLMAVLVSVSFAACSSDDDDDSVNFKNMQMTAGTSTSIENGKGIDWKSENEYIATVSDGTVNALRVGTVKITSEKGSFTVTVSPSSDLYEEPYMKWGSSASSVKSYMSGYTLANETSTGLLYNGKGGATYYAYVFENSGLKYSAVYIPTSYVDELAEFINERYIYATKGDDYTAHLSVDKKVAVFVSATRLNSKYYYQVVYMDFTSSSSSKASTRANSKNDALKGIFKSEFDTQLNSQENERVKIALMQNFLLNIR